MQPSVFTIRPSDTGTEFVLTQTVADHKTEVARGTASETRAWREIAVMAYCAGSDGADIVRIDPVEGADILDTVTVVPRGQLAREWEA